MAFIGFDVYGTLVDPLGMDGPLREHVGDLAERFAATWRERQIDWTFRRALMGRYVDFDVVTREAFRATSAMLGVDLRTAEAGLLETYRRLPAFADAPTGWPASPRPGTGWSPSATASARRCGGC